MIQLNLAPPAIYKYLPRLSGQDNAGIGITKHGERYLLKTDPRVCIAEFVGSALCLACGIPVPEPSIVDFKGREIFGSRLESGVVLPQSEMDVIGQVRKCENMSIFSAVLAIDLAIGNNDRHWHNWLPQPQEGGSIVMRAMDFSRAWPTINPPTPFLSMVGKNTEIVWRTWTALGISYDETAALDVCSDIEKLTHHWLGGIFEQLPVDWMVGASGPELLLWWERNWRARVDEVRNFLRLGAWI